MQLENPDLTNRDKNSGPHDNNGNVKGPFDLMVKAILNPTLGQFISDDILIDGS